MAQSLSKVIVHVVSSKKSAIHGWAPTSVPETRLSCDHLSDAGAEVFRIGGVADHVHVVKTLPRTLSQADMLEGLKKNSKWIKGLNSCENTASSMTNVTCGIKRRPVSRAFSAHYDAVNIPGALPQARS